MARRRVDPELPGERLKRQLRTTLRIGPELDIEDVTDAMNAWARLGHHHVGRRLWPGDEPFGPNYLGRLLSRMGVRMNQELTTQVRQVVKGTYIERERTAKVTPARPVVDEETKKRRAAEERKRREAEAAGRRAEQQQKRERQEAEVERRRVEQAQDIVGRFFAAAGVEVTFEGYVAWLGGRTIPFGRKWSTSTRRQHEWIDAVCAGPLRDVLHQRMRRELGPRLDGLEVKHGTEGLVIARASRSLAVVRGTHARTDGNPGVKGNFLVAGPHWDTLWSQVNDAIDAEARAAQAREDARRFLLAGRVTVHNELPDTVGDVERDAALNASARLRTERNLVFGHVVEVEYGTRTLRFEPIRQVGSHVTCPVRWAEGNLVLEGGLRVAHNRDPLAFAIRGEHPDAVLGAAWVEALAAYATLTCRADLLTLRGTSALRVRRGSSTRTRQSTAEERRTGPVHHVRGGDSLVPLGMTGRWIASYVAGHRRRLRPGQHASKAAQDRARLVGIALGPRETWVSPHVRGIPEDAVLRFRWEAPAGVPA